MIKSDIGLVGLATLGVLMTTIITGLFIYSLSDLLPGNFQ